MEILRVENLTKIYGKGENEVRALDDVSFSVNKGEFIAVIGPSGSGKSTLLHILGGVDRPTSGRVLMDGNTNVDFYISIMTFANKAEFVPGYKGVKRYLL